MLAALNELDGATRWSVAILGARHVDPPAAFGRTVLVASSDPGRTLLSAFDTGSGALRYVTEQTYAPPAEAPPLLPAIALGGAVFAGGAPGGGILSLDASSGSLRWSALINAPRAAEYSHWNPSASSSFVIAQANGTFSAFETSSGQRAFDLAVPGEDPGLVGTALGVSPVFLSPDVALDTAMVMDRRWSASVPFDNTLTIIDVGSRRGTVSRRGQFATAPISGAENRLIFVGNGMTGMVEALSQEQLVTLWTWALPPPQGTGFSGDMVLTRNLLFVAGDHVTFAVDLATRKAVWSYPAGGPLAISANGILYIAVHDTAFSPARSSLVAIDLH